MLSYILAPTSHSATHSPVYLSGSSVTPLKLRPIMHVVIAVWKDVQLEVLFEKTLFRLAPLPLFNGVPAVCSLENYKFLTRSGATL
jgi:hypothetical protein